MLRTCVGRAKVDGSVCVFLEPIALYHTRDLLRATATTAGSRRRRATHVPVGSARTYGDGGDLTIVTCGNGLLMSLRVARRLRGAGHRHAGRRSALAGTAADRGHRAGGGRDRRVLVVDETRRTGGVSEGVIAMLVDAGFDGQLARVTSKDSFVPLGDAANLVLLSEDEIEAAALALV